MSENLKNIKCSDSLIKPKSDFLQKDYKNAELFQASLDKIAEYTFNNFDLDNMLYNLESKIPSVGLESVGSELEDNSMNISIDDTIDINDMDVNDIDNNDIDETDGIDEEEVLSKHAISHMHHNVLKPMNNVNNTFKTEKVKDSIVSDQIANISKLISSNARNILINKGTGDIIVKISQNIPVLNGFDMSVNTKNNGEVFVSFTVSESNRQAISMKSGLDLVAHSVNEIGRLLSAHNMVLASMSFVGHKLKIREATSDNDDIMADRFDKEENLDYDEESKG